MGAWRDSVVRLADVAGAVGGLGGGESGGGVDGREPVTLLEQTAQRLDLLTDLGEELRRALVERPPAQLDEGDSFKHGYDAELDTLRDARDGGKQYIASLQARERERTGIGSLKVRFNRVFG